MKCPNCGVASPDAAAECPSCGLLFAKLKALREKEKREAAEFLALAEQPPAAAPEASRWRGRLIAAGIVMGWLVVFFGWLVWDVNRRAEKSLPPGTVVPVRR